MFIKDPLQRQFYAQMCSSEHWDTRTLDDKIDKQLYLQTALSRKPEEVIKKELAESKEKNQLLPDMVFRSSYFLDILGLPDVFSEKDLENAILSQVEEFLSELGSDFTFVKRQKRITVDVVVLVALRERTALVRLVIDILSQKPEDVIRRLPCLKHVAASCSPSREFRHMLPPGLTAYERSAYASSEACAGELPSNMRIVRVCMENEMRNSTGERMVRASLEPFEILRPRKPGRGERLRRNTILSIHMGR
jgi:predicted nuclease of restriction endonuclease-like (RecB) superfamily